MTAHLWRDAKAADGQSLTLYFRDLDYPINEYDAMFIMVNGERKDITDLSGMGMSSPSVTFNGLEKRHYTANGYVCYNGEWSEVHGGTFPVQDLIPDFPRKGRPKSGGQPVSTIGEQ